MKKGIISLLILSLASNFMFAQSRILDRLEKKAKDKVNQRIDQKADEKMDKELDKVFENNNNSDSMSYSARSMKLARLMLGNQFRECTAKASYSYTTKATMDVYSVGKGKDDSMSFRYYWYSDLTFDHMAMQFVPWSEKMQSMKGSTTIMDLKDSCIITLLENDGKKTLMAIKYGEDDYSKYVDTSKRSVPKKTGKTKKINGKLCYEYVLDDEDTYQQMWIESSKTAIWDKNLKYWKANSDPFKNSAEYGQFFDYFPLEIMTKDKKSEQVTTMFLRSIIKENKTLSTVGYTPF